MRPCHALPCAIGKRPPIPLSMKKTTLILIGSFSMLVSALAEPAAKVEVTIANALGSPKNAPAIIGLAVIDNPKSLLELVSAGVTAFPEQTVEIVRVVLKFAPKRALEIVRAAIIAQPKLAPEIVAMAALTFPDLIEKFNDIAYELSPDEMKARGKTVSFAPVEQPLKSRGASSTSGNTPPSFPAQPIRPDLVSPSS